MGRWKYNFPVWVIIFLFMASFSLIVMMNLKWEKSTEEHILLEQEMTTLRNNVTEAHLWLEEIINGDTLINVNEDVLKPFAHQRFKHFSKTYQEILPNLEELEEKLSVLEEMAQKRLQNILLYQVGSNTDQAFDALFKETLFLIDSTIDQINQKMHKILESKHSFFIWISVVFLFLTILMLILMYYMQKHKRVIQEVLNKEREQLRLAVNGTQIGLWDWNLITNEVYYAPQWKSMLGYEDHELINTYETWRSLIHPDEVILTEQKVMAAIKQQEKMYEVTFRMRHKEGHWVWVLSRAKTICDENNNAVRLIGFHTDVSEQQRMLLELQKSKGKFHSIFHNSPDMHLSVSAKDATVLFCNETLLKVLGYERDEIIGHSVFNLYPDESLDAVKKAFKVFTKKGFVKNAELTVKCKDGTRLAITLNANAVRDDEGNVLYSIATWRDITDIKETETALQSRVAQIHSIFRSAPIGIGFFANRIFQEVNEKFCEMTGYSKEELIGQSSRMIYKDDATYEYIGDAGYIPIQENGSSMLETQFCRKDGTLIDVLLNATPLDPENLSAGVTVSALDITDEKQKDKLMIVQSRHAAMGEMIGMIAHQWRQPISVISLDANNMLIGMEFGDLDTLKAKGYAKNILTQTQHLSKTIDDFRNFFKPDKSVTSVVIEEVLEETYQMMKNVLINHNIKLTTSYASVPTVEAYPRELMQVFVNILHNAKDILIANSREDAYVEIKIYEDDIYVNIEISDNGGGIDEATLPKIFDPYFTTKDEKTGTGLGLYMSKMIIEDHLQGIIEAFNQENGACFRVRLPKCNNLLHIETASMNSHRIDKSNFG
ncbi:MAG: PAS domain S-box protein [Epsilonproteobacteria bacterium]|nr:PAS domain S-box protein [Campylobacterota bacterium]